MKLLHFLLTMTLVGATAKLSADTTYLSDNKEMEQQVTAITNPAVTSAPIAAAPSTLIATDQTTRSPIMVTTDLTEAELTGADATDASFEINPDIMNAFEKEPTLTEKLKMALAYVRMKTNIAYDATGTAISKGYDTVTVHLSKHKKTYIIGTVCVGGILLGVWYFKTRP